MTIALAEPPIETAIGCDQVRVMVVDDAVVARNLISRWVADEPGLQLVASLRGGREAIARIARDNPDVVILDIDMPDLDGMAALPQLLAKKRDLVVIMASTLTRRNAVISLRALALGAADYIAKPDASLEAATATAFRRELLDKIRALTMARKGANAVRPLMKPAGRRRPALDPAEAGLRHVASPDLAPTNDSIEINLRPFPATAPRVLLVGASTGGPPALDAFIGRLNGVIDHVPVLVTQHMPPIFTAVLADHLARVSGRPAGEAVHGEPVVAGRIYVAPGGRHLCVVRRDGIPIIELDDGPRVNFCKPSVDLLLSSAAAVWGARNLAVILTGMGSDGTLGASDVVAAGGCVIAQDQASSVVWGMPRAVAQAGLCSAILPIDQMASMAARLFAGVRS